MLVVYCVCVTFGTFYVISSGVVVFTLFYLLDHYYIMGLFHDKWGNFMMLSAVITRLAVTSLLAGTETHGAPCSRTAPPLGALSRRPNAARSLACGSGDRCSALCVLLNTALAVAFDCLPNCAMPEEGSELCVCEQTRSHCSKMWPLCGKT